MAKFSVSVWPYLSLHVKIVLKMARAGILPAVRLSKRCVRFDLEE